MLRFLHSHKWLAFVFLLWVRMDDYFFSFNLKQDGRQMIGNIKHVNGNHFNSLVPSVLGRGQHYGENMRFSENHLL